MSQFQPGDHVRADCGCEGVVEKRLCASEPNKHRYYIVRITKSAHEWQGNGATIYRRAHALTLLPKEAT